MQAKGKEDRKEAKSKNFKRHNLQMPKPNRNDCKNGKQTDLLVQGSKSAVQNSK